MRSFREANRAADFLTNQNHDRHFPCATLEAPPPGLRIILYEDKIGSSLPRMVPLVIPAFPFVIKKS